MFLCLFLYGTACICSVAHPVVCSNVVLFCVMYYQHLSYGPTSQGLLEPLSGSQAISFMTRQPIAPED